MIHQSKRIVTVLFSIMALFLLGMNRPENIHGKVVCFGDSITHGAHVDGHSWVFFLSMNHPDINFVNAGRNGRKTSDKKELLPVLKKNPNANYYLIFLGVNDLKDGTRTEVNQCVQNMKWMIQKIRGTDAHAHIVILAPTTINLITMAPYNVKKKYNENTKKSLVILKRKYQKLAKSESVQFISLLHTVSPPNYVDGLHPDVAGQRQIAHAVWKGMEKLYN
ncbi:MAG TPA: SGNH/GDSL hydrolase family protein [Balneolaceae bacterium]|nr:SGNH/GDSL hydrolase family protein [Balneolaceae bacterium]